MVRTVSRERGGLEIREITGALCSTVIGLLDFTLNEMGEPFV